MLVLATLGALSCAEAARERDTVALLYLAAASRGGPELATALGADLPAPQSLLDQIRLLDRRLAACG